MSSNKDERSGSWFFDVLQVFGALALVVVLSFGCLFIIYADLMRRAEQEIRYAEMMKRIEARERSAARRRAADAARQRRLEECDRLFGQISGERALGKNGAYSWGLNPWEGIRGPIVPESGRVSNCPPVRVQHSVIVVPYHPVTRSPYAGMGRGNRQGFFAGARPYAR